MKLDVTRALFRKRPEVGAKPAPYDCRKLKNCLGGCRDEQDHFWYNRPSRIQKCEGECEETTRCYSVPSQTMYSWDKTKGIESDPNADHWMCYWCGSRYTEMMNDQWAEYNNGLL